MMVYYKNSAMYRLKFPLGRMVSGKSMEQQVNEVDGYGNPKGEVYSKSELKALLERFQSHELWVSCLQNWMILPWAIPFLKNNHLKPFERLFGWLLYAKCSKPK